MPNDFGDLLDLGNLLELIKPALTEMVIEGFAQTWRVDFVKRDNVQFRNKTRDVWIVWDGSSQHRWLVESGDRSGRGASLALAVSAARTVGILL